MSLQRKLLALAAPLALLTLGGCAAGLPTQVSRFQAMPAPQGQSFAIVPADVKGGLEFGEYAGLVSRHLTALGYREAPSREAANFVVEIGYGVDQGRERVVSRRDPFRPAGFGGYGYGYGRPFHYSRFGYFGRYRSPFYYGWDDPYWYGRGFDRIERYTVYNSHLEMDIRGTDGRPLFEGRAQARSTTDDLTALVPNLLEAMFTDFPGRSGETVRITVPPRRDR
jgi:hypothetical protein